MSRQDVADAQRVLTKANPSLQIDGKWGFYTNNTYLTAPASVREEVDRVLRRRGTSASELYARRMAAKERKDVTVAEVDVRGTEFISEDDASRMVLAYSRQLGLGQYTGAFVGFLRMEARQMSEGGVRGYDVRSRNGSSRGLFQMQPGAWTDAAKVTKVGDYARYVYDPSRNILAGIAYAKFNIDILTKVGARTLKRLPPVEAETLYLMHNQGVGFFTAGKVTAYEKQSREARVLIDKWKDFYARNRR